MPDVDEQWVERLRSRVDGVVPDVPVDVDDALRGGRRRRSARRLAGAGATLAVVAGLALGVPALTSAPDRGHAVVADPTTADVPETRPGDAEIVDAPDCFADDIVGSGGTAGEVFPGTGLDDVLAEQGVRPAPAAGAVPEGFRAVAAVVCRVGPESRVHSLQPAVYEEVRLEGDIDGLVAALALPSQADQRTDGTICNAMAILLPALYLVDDRGRAVRPAFPAGVCHPRPEPLDALATLTVVSTTTYEGRFDSYDDEQLQEGVGLASRALHDAGLPWSAVRPAPDATGLVVAGPGWASAASRPDEVDALLDATLPGVPITFASEALDPGSRPLDVAAINGFGLMDLERSGGTGGPSPAGLTLEITYPQGTARGAGYVLERFVGGWYQAEILLTAVPAGSGLEPSWAPLEQGASWEDVLVTGPGPDLLQIPDAADGEYYRLCTANAPQNLCVELF